MNGQVNHMDSIARPTSKVIQPPGGSSSGIFGDRETYEPKVYLQGNRKNASNIFGAPEEDVPKPKTPPKQEEVRESSFPFFSSFSDCWSTSYWHKTHLNQSRSTTWWKIINLLRLENHCNTSQTHSRHRMSREPRALPTWIFVIEKNKFITKYFHALNLTDFGSFLPFQIISSFLGI